MLHARKDYQSIQPLGNDPNYAPTIGNDEPVFLLRAKDLLAPKTIEFWACNLMEAGGDLETVNHVLGWAKKMREWQKNNDCQLPTAPKEVHQTVE